MQITIDVKDLDKLVRSDLIDAKTSEAIIKQLIDKFQGEELISISEELEIIEILNNLDCLDDLLIKEGVLSDSNTVFRHVGSDIFYALYNEYLNKGSRALLEMLLKRYPVMDQAAMITSVIDTQAFIFRDSGTSINDPRELAKDAVLRLELCNWTLQKIMTVE